MQGAARGSRCWLCRLSLEATVEVPPPPRPLPVDGPDGHATAVALVVGLVSVGGGALLISGGYGLVSTLIVVLPCAWILGDAAFSSPASPPAARPAPAPAEGGAGRQAVGLAATLYTVFVVAPLALLSALFTCCMAVSAGASLATFAGMVFGPTVEIGVMAVLLAVMVFLLLRYGLPRW